VNSCKSCGAQVNDSFYFCPNCGKKLKEPPFKFSIGKSIGLLLFSFLFPPFGIIPGAKYFLKNDVKAQVIGLLAIAITIISSILLVILTINIVNRTMETYSQIMKLQSGGAISAEEQTQLLNQFQEIQ
jgi:hypothetical protein